MVLCFLYYCLSLDKAVLKKTYLLWVGVVVSVFFSFSPCFTVVSFLLFSELLRFVVLALLEDDSLDLTGEETFCSTGGFDSDLLVTDAGVRLCVLSF